MSSANGSVRFRRSWSSEERLVINRIQSITVAIFRIKETQMITTVNRVGFWNENVWRNIDDGVTKTALAIRVAQKVFPTVQLSSTSVPADIFNPEKMSIEEGHTRPYIELAAEFPLKNGQVNEDPNGLTAITLSKFAAKTLALAEDMLILQGREAELPHNVRVESGLESIGKGILGLVPDHRRIVVKPPDQHVPTNSGGHIYAAVVKGISLLMKDTQGPPYALIEDTNAFAATWGGVINGAPAYSALNALLKSGIFGTGAMPPNTGLLIALGGDPTTIYICDEPITEPTQKERSGQYSFRTFERVQYVARDHRAFVTLDFSYLAKDFEEEAQGREISRRKHKEEAEATHGLPKDL
jgi:uncharacterized linocin/CFP29 family protein